MVFVDWCPMGQPFPVNKIFVITILALGRIIINNYNFKNYSPKQDVTSRNPICAEYHAGQMRCASWLRMLEDLF